MIGLLFLIGIGLWLIAAFVISVNMPRWLRLTKHHTVVALLSFPVVLAVPVADDLIGRWQFYRLCDREAVVTLSADWEKVKKAKAHHLIRTKIVYSLIPIYSHISEYFDIETDRVFLTTNLLTTPGGFLLDRLGLGLGTSSQCLPKNMDLVFRQVNLDNLTGQGKNK